MTPAISRPDPSERDLASSLLVLWGWKRFIAVGTVTAFIVTFGASLLLPKAYKATGTVMLVDQKVSEAAPIRPGGDYKAVHEVVLQLLRNEASLAAVIAETPALAGARPDQLAGRIDIQTLAYSPVVVASFEAATPQLSREVLDKVLKRAVDLNAKMTGEEVTGSRAFLRTDLDETQKVMLAAREQLRVFTEQARLDERKENLKSTLSQRGNLVENLADARSDLSGASASRAALTEAVKNNSSTVKLSRSVLDDPTAQQLARERGTSSAGLTVSTEELNPTATEAARLLQQAISDEAGARARVDTLTAEIAAIDRRLPQMQAELARATVESERLNREYELAADSYKQAVDRYDDARVVVATRLPQMRVLSAAMASPRPVSPRPALNAGAAAVAAFILCVVFALVAEALGVGAAGARQSDAPVPIGRAQGA